MNFFFFLCTTPSFLVSPIPNLSERLPLHSDNHQHCPSFLLVYFFLLLVFYYYVTVCVYAAPKKSGVVPAAAEKIVGHYSRVIYRSARISRNSSCIPKLCFRLKKRMKIRVKKMTFEIPIYIVFHIRTASYCATSLRQFHSPKQRRYCWKARDDVH